MVKILDWFKHPETVNTETEGDRRARENFNKKVEYTEPKKHSCTDSPSVPYPYYTPCAMAWGVVNITHIGRSH
jgi:hypothetical protein